MRAGTAALAAALAAALSGCAVLPLVAGDDGPSPTASPTAGTTTSATSDGSATTTSTSTTTTDTSTTTSAETTTTTTPPPPGSALDEILAEFSAERTGEGSVVTLGDAILFGLDSASLAPEAAPVLDRLAEALVLAGKRRVVIRGHTDSRGDDAYNVDLSTRRAAAVRDYLVAKPGLTPDRFEIVGVGEAEPVAPEQLPDGSDDPAGRERNRRVEVLIRDP